MVVQVACQAPSLLKIFRQTFTGSYLGPRVQPAHARKSYKIRGLGRPAYIFVGSRSLAAKQLLNTQAPSRSLFCEDMPTRSRDK
jgi:hypothetical protein